MERLRIATVWLGGCSGCHMSFLDLDEWLIDLAQLVDLVYSPVIDVKVYPENVDVCLVEGAVANADNLEMAHRIRRQTKTVVAFGDCAVTGNVTSLRNLRGTPTEFLEDCYQNRADHNPSFPGEPEILPVLLDQAVPLHAVIPVDFHLPGCPPDAARIRSVLESLAQGTTPALAPEQRRFG